MKKVLSIVFLVAAMLFASNANAQIKFGLKGGLNVTSMSFSEDVFDASNKTGFFVGPMVKVTVPIVGLSFDAAALYDQKEADVKYAAEGELGKVNVKQQSINIPVNVRYGFGLSSLANIFLFAGPQWGINVGDKNFKWNETSSYSLKKSNFSVNVGAGVTLLNHLQVSANYNIACGKSADASLSKALDAAANAGKDKSHNNSWQIALGYWF
ncbi:porin family protein [Prevotella copri]|uniref:Porin family protein n=1 Tax=Segatella copri TaxID=165179 RepID=A0A6G1U2L8_9BACT|nr:porin family protein [Segatella copri]MQN81793.1 porin family protein [Segatella copri]